MAETLAKKLESLYTELNTNSRLYRELEERMVQMKAHLLRLEGAIQIVRALQEEGIESAPTPNSVVDRPALMKS